MNALPSLLLPLAVLLANDGAPPCNLEITIRPHADQIIFGDPLYVEVTIVNRGKERISALPNRGGWATHSIVLEIRDSETQMRMISYPHGDYVGPRHLEPGETVKLYQYCLLPDFHLFDHPFWKQLRVGGGVYVAGLYRLTASGVAVRGKWHYVTVKARDEAEIASLEYWNKKEVNREDYKKGPTPANFHLPVNVANRKEMGEFAFHSVLDGELGGLVVLSLRLRDLYDLPPERREAGNRALVEWLRKEPEAKRVGDFYLFPSPEGGLERVRFEPEVKRQVLARRVRSLAASYNMTSTVKAIEDAFGGREALEDP